MMSTNKNLIIVKYEGTAPPDVSTLGTVTHHMTQIRTLYLRPDGDPDEVLVRLATHPQVVRAEFDVVLPASEMRNTPEPLPLEVADIFETNNGIYSAVDVYGAHEITKGHPDVVICHLDFGADQSHPDLNFIYGGTFTFDGIMDLSPANDINRVRLNDTRMGPLDPWYSNPMVDKVNVVVNQYDRYRFAQSITPIAKKIFSDPGCTQEIETDVYGTWNVYGIPDPVFYMHGFCTISVIVDGPDEAIYQSLGSVVGLGDTSCFDNDSHGTATLSLINAQHNGTGVAGVAPNCTTVHFRLVDAGDRINAAGVAACLMAAADYISPQGKPCKIMSCSWYYGYTENAVIKDAMEYALGKDICMCMSSGNDGTSSSQSNNSFSDNRTFPALVPGAWPISGTGNPSTSIPPKFIPLSEDFDNTTVAPTSSRFPEVFISAPKGMVAVAFPRNPTLTHDEYTTTYRPHKLRYYGIWKDGGTSSAAPIQAAVTGLVFSRAVELGLPMDRATAAAILQGTCNPNIKLSNGQRCTQAGAGVVNARNAVMAVGGSIVQGPDVSSKALPVRITTNVTDSTRQAVVRLASWLAVENVIAAADGVEIFNGTATGNLTLTMPSGGAVLKELVVTVTHDGGKVYTMTEPVVVNPVADTVYTYAKVVGGKLRWGMGCKSSASRIVKDIDITLDGRVLESYHYKGTGSATIVHAVTQGCRGGVTELATHPKGDITFKVTSASYDTNNVAYVMTPSEITVENPAGFDRPQLTAFNLGPSGTRTKPVTMQAAPHYYNIVAYYISETPVAPAITGSQWRILPPETFTLSADTVNAVYGWALDEDGNISEAVVWEPKPFDPPAGRYQEAQTVALTGPAGGIIVYTRDGSDPRHYIPVDEFTGKASFDENTGTLVLTDEPYAP